MNNKNTTQNLLSFADIEINGTRPWDIQVHKEHLYKRVLYFGTDYDKTLMAWYENFEKNWPVLKNKYDERFYRMWKYYLLLSAGAFRSRKIQLWQIVLSKNGVPGGYISIR